MQSPFKVTISLVSGSGPESLHVFDADRTLVIGKAPDCGLKVEARGVSRMHCQLEGTQQGWNIIDLDSTSGISINGKAFAGPDQPVMKQPLPLCDGDEIGTGEAVLRMQIESKNEDHTEMLVPKQFVGKGEADTEILTPHQAQHAIGGGKPATGTSNSAEEKKSANQTSANPMNRPKTVLVSIPKEAKPAVQKSSDSLLSKAASGEGMPPSPFAFKVPGEFRNYWLEKRIGVGGMGEVFLARKSERPHC